LEFIVAKPTPSEAPFIAAAKVPELLTVKVEPLS
jgi:hypothetical protein